MGEIIVNEEEFLLLFGEYRHRQAKQYLRAKLISQKISNCSEIARKINQPNRTVAEWISGNKIPNAIKQLNFLKSIGLLPLKYSSKPEFVIFTELVAFLFGDGHLMKHLGAFCLVGQQRDLEIISSKLNEFLRVSSKLKFFNGGSTIKKIIKGAIKERVVKGSSWRLSVNNSGLARLLNLAGVPLGDKVSVKTRIPDWIMNGDIEIKRAFLSVLFGNELQCPRIRAKNAFSSPQFGLHKIESKKEELQVFLEQIKNLLEEFKISTSPVRVDTSYKTIRKDGSISRKLYFSIDSHSPNIVCLFKEIPFKYAEEKQGRFEKAVKQFLKNSEWLKQEWRIYEKAMKLRKEGLGHTKIFKQLNLPNNYLYKINAWIYYGNKPLYYGKFDWSA